MRGYLISGAEFVVALGEVAVGHGDARAVEYGLREFVVHLFGGNGGRPQRVPYLLAALEGGRSVPELVPLAAQLALGEGHV